jgi:23S rRNA (guanosine2251-2'-O)-methyltransferase
MKNSLHIILDNIRSAFNVGAIFRTSDASGVEKLWLTGITPYPPHNRIPKTALGSTETVNWEYQKGLNIVIESLKNNGCTIIGAELSDKAITYTDYKFPEKSAIIFGNEINGISPEILDKCDAVVQIPMFGKKESLNVEVSCAVIIYEVIRQWSKPKN